MVSSLKIDPEDDLENGTILHLLHKRSQNQPDDVIFTYLPDGDTLGAEASFLALERQSQAVAAALQQSEIQPGSRALLLFPPGIEYITGFFGCLYAGIVAVPSQPPDPERIDQTLPRVLAVAGDAQVSAILTTRPVLQLASRLAGQAPQLGQIRWVATDAIPQSLADQWIESYPSPDDLAYLQYTSGSTRMPRGVRLTHTNLLYNSWQIYNAFRMTREDVGVIWLPMYHNLGLVGGVLQPLFYGGRCILMSPLAFLQKPIRWLQAITRFKGTVSGGPNFGYDLCVQRVPPDQREGLDLSSWDLAFNGAEPVRAETIQRFIEAYQPHGLRPEAIYPAYGLAEATLMVTGAVRGSGATRFCLDRQALGEHEVKIAPEGDPHAQISIGCGGPVRGEVVVIVDPQTCLPVEADKVGEIWVRGPNIAKGYWNHPEENAATFDGFLAGTGDGPYLRTGDLGFLKNGECVITGRIKDLIIIRGKNFYPQDIEREAERVQPVPIPNGCAAFSVERDGQEQLVIIQEIDPQEGIDLDAVTRSIREAVLHAHELKVTSIVLVRSGGIPKTANGKVQRRACREAYLKGGLPEISVSNLEPDKNFSNEPASETGVAERDEYLLRAAIMAMGPDVGQQFLISHLRPIFARVLKVNPKELENDQPLSALGLDSITTIELSGELENVLHVPIPIPSLLKGDNLTSFTRELFRQITGLEEAGKAFPTNIPDQPAPQEIPIGLPLSQGQRALWFVQRLIPESVAHNIVYAGRLFTRLDSTALQQCFQKIVDRHPALRTTFAEVNGQPVQRIHPYQEACIREEDASGWDDARLEERLAQEVHRVFNLETGPLFVVTHLRRSAEESILILALHHIITDLWSMAILLHEFGMNYPALINHQEIQLPPPPATYADHVQSEAEMLSGPAGEAHWDYWKQRLAEPLSALNLPGDRPRPDIQTGKGAACPSRLGPELTREVKSLAVKLRIDVFSLLLASFDVLLHRYTGQTDIIIGSPKACRNRQNAGTMGYFINSVVLRSDLSGEPRFADFAQKVYQNTRADFQHDAYPYTLLVERLMAGREPGRGGMFQVFYSWQKTNRLVDRQVISSFAMGENVRTGLNGLPIEAMSLKARVSPTDLALLAVEMDDDLAITFEYSTDLFDDATILRMQDQLKTLLKSITADPSLPISRLPILPEWERKWILEDWNRQIEPVSIHESGLVEEWIERQAERIPNAVALTFSGRDTSYWELQRQIGVLSRSLVANGVHSENPVGVCLPRSTEAIAAQLAVLKAGGAYLPLDPEYPPERLEYMISDAGARVVITHSGLRARLPAKDIRLICLDVASEISDPNLITTHPETMGGPIQPDHLAYIMYTSGSTGRPKGVLIPHRAIAHHCRFMQSYYQLGPDDRVLQFASPSFDASLEQILTALMCGARLFLRDVELWDPADLSGKIHEMGLTVVNLPPSYWQQWIRAEANRSDPISNPQLRLVIVGGDVVLPEHLSLWQHTPMRGARLINAYGPTETTITATAYEIPADIQPEKIWRVPIGGLLAGRSAYVLDPYLQLAPIGVPGELAIGDPCLADGYHRLPEATAERFIPDPFSVEKGRRIYRTGDLVRLRSDGNLEFLGRIDNQVKIRGMRIELGEVEAVLLKHPAVSEAAVLLDGRDSDAQLVACIVPAPGRQIVLTEVEAFLGGFLPGHMIPTCLLTMDRLPLTPGGKLDRDAIAQVARSNRLGGQESHLPPRNAIEEQLVCIWKELLNVERVGIYDNFFNLGGHSLLATRLASRLRSEFHVELPLIKLFETPTIAGLAVAITQAMAAEEDDGDLSLLLDEIEQLPDDPRMGGSGQDGFAV